MNLKLIVLMLHSILLCNISGFSQNLLWSKKCAPTSKETYAVAFSQDGERLFSGSECTPTSLRIFDSYDGSIYWETTLDSPLMCAQGIKFSSNGSRVVALEELGNLIVYDYSGSTPVQINSIPTGTNYAFAIAFSPDGNKLATGCSDTKMIIHDVNSGSVLHNISAHANWVTGIDWSSQEKIVTCGDDGRINLWDTAGNNIWSIVAHPSYIGCVRFSSDGNYIVSGSRDKTLKIWNTADGSLVRTLTGHTREVKYLDISDDMSQIVSGAIDSTIRVWDFDNGTLMHTFSVPNSGKVYTVDFQPGSNRYLAAGTSNGDVQVWDMLFPTHTETAATPKVSIYPNPCIDEVFLHGTISEKANLQLFDVTGKRLNVAYKWINNQAVINTNALIGGHYTLEVISGNKKEIHNFIKQ